MLSKNSIWGIVLVIALCIAYISIFFINQTTIPNEEVQIYFADRVTAAHRLLINRYNDKMKGKIRVVPIDFPNFDFSTNERKEILARSLRGTGDGIDLFAVDIVWVQRFAKWCVPFDDYLTEDEKNSILDLVLQSCYYKNKLVAVPLDFVQGMLYYREDLIKQLPNSDGIISKLKKGMTWNEFVQLKQLTDPRKPFYIYPAADYEGLICSYMDNLLSQDKNYFQKYEFDLKTAEAEKALQLLVDLVNTYKVTPQIVTSFTEIPSYKYFIENDGYFIRGWQSYDKDFKQFPFDSVKERMLRKAPLPYLPGAKPAAVIGGWHLMLSKFSNKKKEVVDFVKYLLSEEAQELFYKESGYFPVIKKIYDDPKYIAKYPEMVEIREELRHGVNRPAHEEYTRFSKIMSFYFEEAIKNKISVKEALAKATEAIQLEETLIREL